MYIGMFIDILQDKTTLKFNVDFIQSQRISFMDVNKTSVIVNCNSQFFSDYFIIRRHRIL
jgi:hypothetical protein